MQIQLPPQAISVDVIQEKYCKGNETTEKEIFKRVAKGIASNEKTAKLRASWEKKFLEMMEEGGIGGGRIMAAAGTDIQATLNNCFTQPVGDSIIEVDENGIPGIYTALAEAAETLRRGGGVGYDFSNIRPMNAFVKGTSSFASGPCSYMDVFDKSCSTVESAGCFAGDTLINTDKGLVTVKYIVEHPEIEYSALTHLGYRKITARFNNGEKQLYKVTTEYGYSVRVTDEHKFAQFSEGKIITRRLKDILSSDNKRLLLLSPDDKQEDQGHYWKDMKGFGFHDSIFKKYFQDSDSVKIPMSVIENLESRFPELLNTVTVEITSVEENSIEIVYDLEVDEVHLLAGNGIYTSNSRRGAQLGALRVDHPDIEYFITAKRQEKRWNNFNVSVFVTDEFMKAIQDDLDFQLTHKAKPTDKLINEKGSYQREDGLWVYETIKARSLWEKIMKSNYDFAEPGILFADNINRDNNLRYCEEIKTTNPCGEQPLPPYGCCDLGSIILPKLVKNPFTPQAVIDFEKLEDLVSKLVRFLDNVLDVTFWPLEKQRMEAMNKRRIGLGFTGLGNALAMLNLRYDQDEGRAMAQKIVSKMTYSAYWASTQLAVEKGAFPLFDADKYLEEGTFASRLPEDIKNAIRKCGIRNSHLMTVAPGGTVSLAFADNTSNGIEPPFSLAYIRKKRKQHGGEEFYTVLDHSLRVFLAKMENRDIAEAIEKALCEGEKEFKLGKDTLQVKKYLPDSLVTALEMSADEHLAMMASIQPFICSSISKTINVAADYPFEDFKNIYLKAHEYGLKGVATYRPNNILGSVLSEIKKEEPKVETPVVKEVSDNEEFEIFMNKVVHQLPNDEYIAHRKKISYLGPEGNDNLYLLLSIDQKTFERDGKKIIVERPVEVFIETNPDNVPSEWVDSLSRNLSLLARSGINMFVKALDNCKKAKSDKGRIRYGWIVKPDGTKVPRYHASQIDCIGFAVKEILKNRNIINEVGKPYTLEQLFKLKSTIPSEVEVKVEQSEVKSVLSVISGKVCEECGCAAVIKKDGCKFCTNCGAEGACG